MEKVSIHVIGMFVMSFLLVSGLQAEPTRRSSSFQHTSVGLRLGWVGAPNGLTYRRGFAPGHAIELVAGYNPKYGRRADIPAIQKGNSFLSFSYAPNFTMCMGGAAVGIYADLGLRLNYHHYRTWEAAYGHPPITPDLIGGAGMQIEFAQSVEVFADMHLKYFSSPGNYFTPGVESGAGIRVWLN